VDFLEKPFDNEVLLERIAEAINKDIANRKQLDEYSRIKKRLDYLTQREQEVLSLIVKGRSNKDVAKALDISNRTVEAHRARIMEKMQAECLADLVMMATYPYVLNANLNNS
jgi:FixJ family two-component response regulator